MSVAFLSAIETGRKPTPDGLVVKISRKLRWPKEDLGLLTSAIDRTRKEVRVDDKPPEKREMIANFARNFDDVPPATMDQLKKLFNLKSVAGEIPLAAQVDSGPLWDPNNRTWHSRFVELPMPNDDKLLLVPKEIVRATMEYDVEKYYRHYILERMREAELEANSELVQILKSGARRVTKKSLIEKYGRGKRLITEQTVQNPDLLQRYKTDLGPPGQPLAHSQLADIENTPAPNWDRLLQAVLDLPVGNDAADAYEKSIEALLSALFYPVLTHPVRQRQIHQGRKRIDITYSNMASQGFFQWLAMHHPSGHIFVECKNYGNEIGNPELDQIAGRFSMARGKFGLIVCRNLQNRARFEQGCRDTATDDRGYVICLDDNDLRTLAQAKQHAADFFELQLLRRRFNNLVL